jgi:hypothetical protein
MKKVVAGVTLMLFVSIVGAQPFRSPESLRAEIEALRAPRVAWREIAWRSCLLEGLKESRSKGMPRAALGLH